MNIREATNTNYSQRPIESKRVKEVATASAGVPSGRFRYVHLALRAWSKSRALFASKETKLKLLLRR